MAYRDSKDYLFNLTEFRIQITIDVTFYILVKCQCARKMKTLTWGYIFSYPFSTSISHPYTDSQLHSPYYMIRSPQKLVNLMAGSHPEQLDLNSWGDTWAFLVSLMTPIFNQFESPWTKAKHKKFNHKSCPLKVYTVICTWVYILRYTKMNKIYLSMQVSHFIVSFNYITTNMLKVLYHRKATLDLLMRKMLGREVLSRN
jgi:hypothetical protein